MLEHTNILNKIKNSYLNSFGIVNQFIELTFSNDQYEEIKFFIDCEINSSDNKINEIRSFFDTIDKDVSCLAYFLKANRQKIVDITNSKESLSIKFLNDFEIYFDFDFETSLSITFKEKLNLDIAYRIDFEDGEVSTKSFL